MIRKYSCLCLVLLFTLVACDKGVDANSGKSFTKVKLTTVTLTIEKMTCAACPLTIRLALRKVPGVASAKVDYKTKTATVSFDPKVTNVAALNRASTNAGYPSRLKTR